MIDNARASHSLSSSVGGKVYYACLEGYIRLSGDYYLTCTTSDNSVHSWTGSIIECGLSREGGKCKGNLGTDLKHSRLSQNPMFIVTSFGIVHIRYDYIAFSIIARFSHTATALI